MWRASSRAVQVGVARGQPHVQQPAAAGAEPRLAPIGSIRATSGSCSRRKPGARAAGAKASSSAKSSATPCAVQVHARSPAATRARDRAAPRRAPAPCASRAGEAFLDGVHERRMRPDLQPDVDAEIRQRRHRGREVHRLPDAARPMLRRRTPRPAHCRPVTVLKNGTVSGCGCRSASASSSAAAAGSHERMMKRMIHPHQARKDALRLQFGQHRLERKLRSRPGSASVGPLNAAIVTVRSCRAISAARRLFVEADRQHGPFAAGAFVHETRPQHDDPRGFLQAENARDAGRRDLADAVPDDRRRLARPTISKAPPARLASRRSPAARSRCGASARLPRCAPSSSSSEKRAHGRIAASQRSIAWRKTGSCRISSRPMPHHCGPWPLITKAMRGAVLLARGEGGARLRALLAAGESRPAPAPPRPCEPATSVSR